MTVTSKLKKQVDLPVWEWLRFSPVTGVVTSTMTTSDGMGDRFLYVLHSSTNFWRYDTWSDSWQQLANPAVAIATVDSLRYSTYNGYRGRVISNTDSTHFTASGLFGNVLDGYKIRINGGTGLGQERTITNVAEPVVADSGIATATTNTLQLQDTTKAWTINQWVGYQIRITLGTGATQVRKILYNNATTIVWADTNWGAIEPRYYCPMVTAPVAAASFYSIESSTFTIDQAWTTNPDNTSKFVVLSGGIWCVSSQAGAPYYNIQFYDIAADTWYTKTGAGGIFAATALVTESSLERTGEVAGIYTSGTTASGTNLTVVSNEALTANRWNNYAVKITGGTGIGQVRIIVSNDATTFTVTRRFDINPDNTSTYSVMGDTDKIYFVGNGQASMYMYGAEADQWSIGHQYDYGAALTCAVQQSPFYPAIGISAISGNGTTSTATTVFNHNLRVGDTITITGASPAGYNVTTTVASLVSLTQFTYLSTGNGSATFAATAQSATVLFDTTKNWTNSEHVGRILHVSVIGPNATSQLRKITANTNNSITVSPALTTAAVNGTSRYVITDMNALGSWDSGTSTSTGSTTVITDSGKTWVASSLIGKRVKFTSGVGAGQESPITANTANTVTFTVITTAQAIGDTYSILPPAKGAGIELMWLSGLTDTTKAGKYMICFRGGASNAVDRYNICTEQWEMMPIFPQSETFTTGTQYAYDGADTIYIQKDNTLRFYAYNCANNTLVPAGIAPYAVGATLIGNRMEVIETEDGLKYLYFLRHSGVEFYRILIWW
jgi:hypothetical protein